MQDGATNNYRYSTVYWDKLMDQIRAANKALSECRHQGGIDLVVTGASEYRDKALEGGVEVRCSFCKKLVGVRDE